MMNRQNSEEGREARAPSAVVKNGRHLSLIWVIPIVALIIGSWLAIKAISEQGPEIKISFETVEGLEVDKTKIKFHDVEIGLVTKIELNDDLSGVIVTANMKKDADKYMRDKTQFWVVRARVAAGEISGLGTLFSGVYIGCNPSLQGKPVTDFAGLEKPPIVTAGMPGRHFVLEAASLGSLDVGSPVYYRGINVGQVVEYDFNELAEAINVRVFINAPYHEKVRENTRFWNASGVDFSLNAEGVSVDTQSLVSIILGGVAFDLPNYLEPVNQAEKDRVFKLYDSRKDIEERTYLVKRYYLMYFDQNVRGLSIGAPVEIRGIKIGEVVDVKLKVDIDEVSARVAVLAVVEPERIDTNIDKTPSLNESKDAVSGDESIQNVAKLVDKGLRAQLKSGNLLTGQLYVDLDFFPDAEPAKITKHNGYQLIPTLPAPFEQIAQRVNNILKKVEKMPLEEIGRDLHETIKSLQVTLKAVEKMAGGVNKDVLPELTEALDEFQNTMSGIEQTLGPDSALNYNARTVMSELTSTVRSLRALIDYVERNPQSVLFGKETE